MLNIGSHCASSKDAQASRQALKNVVGTVLVVYDYYVHACAIHTHALYCTHADAFFVQDATLMPVYQWDLVYACRAQCVAHGCGHGVRGQ